MINFFKTHELSRRFLCMVLILGVFIVGRNIVLYKVDVSALLEQNKEADNILLSAVSGDLNRYSIFALGIMPYMSASILVQVVLLILPKDVRKRISKHKIEKITIIGAFIFACFLAYSRASELVYMECNLSKMALSLISVVEMITGAMFIIYICHINKERGIGGQTPIILINVVEGLYTSIKNNLYSVTYLLVILCLAVLFITLLIENVELHIPVQRVSIHNIYADKNYIAFKLNPIGVMPVMFSSSIFILVKYIFYALGGIFKDSTFLLNLNANMDLTSKTGVNTYLIIVFLFTIIFSFAMLAPSDMADNLQKGGDSIVGVYAGRDTKRYFFLAILLLSVVSGVVLASCMALSLYLSLLGNVSSDLATLPSSIMILVSVLSNILSEAYSYYKLDMYKFFI